MLDVIKILNAPIKNLSELPDQGRADLALALLTSLSGPAGLALIFGVMAQVDAHADEIYRSEFEKEC